MKQTVLKVTKFFLAAFLMIQVLSGCSSSTTTETANPEESETSQTAQPEKGESISYNDLDETDKEMLASIYKMQTAAQANLSEIWEGQYDIANMPLVMVRTDQLNGTEVSGAFAFNITSFDAGIQQKTVTDLPENLSFKNIVYLPFDANNETEKKWTAGYNFDYFDMDGVHIEYVCYYPGIVDTRMLYMVTHEGFHEFVQVAKWKNVNDISSVVERHEEDKYTQEIVQSEMMVSVMLQQAMNSQDLEEVKQILKDTLIIRNAYMTQWPFLEQEKQSETIEGTAEYSSYTMDNFMASRDKNDPTLFLDYNRYFHAKAEEWPEDKYGDSMMVIFYKDLYYYWGVAYLAAMDRLDLPYIEPIQDNQKLIWDLSTEYFAPDGLDSSPETIQAIQTKYHYEDYADLAAYWCNILNTHEKVMNIN